MSDKQDQGPWSPDELYTDTAQSLVSSSAGITEAKAHIRTLARHLADKRLPSVEDLQWLINVAYVALDDLQNDRIEDEHNARLRQGVSQQNDEILTKLREIPPYEPAPVPDWLSAIVRQEGGQ